MEVLEKKQEKIFLTLNLADFLYMTPKAQTMKVKIGKLDYIKLKDFYTSKNKINRL